MMKGLKQNKNLVQTASLKYKYNQRLGDESRTTLTFM
jgi:hypothetical protein